MTSAAPSTQVHAHPAARLAARRTMKAAILERQQAPLVVADDVEIPLLGVGHVLVKIAYSGICGKQLEEISGRRGADPFLPHLLGHEGAGTVEEIGPGVRKVKPADHVVLHWMKGSGIDAVPASFSRNGSKINAGCVTTFSEYTVASENRLTPVLADLELDVAALLGCAVTTGLGIVFNNAALKPGQSIAVFGIGGVGLNVLQGAALVSAYPIVAIDVQEHKLKQASAFGATHAFNMARCDPSTILHTALGGRPFDVVVDTTGQRDVRQMAYDLTSPTGVTVLAGVPHHQDRLHIDSFPLHFGRRIVGSHGGDTRPDVDIPRAIQLYRLGKLKLKEQITHCFALAEINAAIACVQQGRVGRCLVVMP